MKRLVMIAMAILVSVTAAMTDRVMGGDEGTSTSTDAELFLARLEVLIVISGGVAS